ncbi:MAG: alpha/beta fold hydrolase [Nitrospirae bacterium]|nr:alpha/beta fold hydrolase [Nitrospirota bacterium]
MNLDITLHKGRTDRPAVIFIHGLGMDKRIWATPDDARIVGGSFPLRFLLSKKPKPIDHVSGKNEPVISRKRFSFGESSEELKTSFHDLKSVGYTVITWSQKRPAGPVDIAVEELREVLQYIRRYSKQGIILIGHSRGGLIARKYFERKDKIVKGLITLATPHHGSSMAKWAQYISPLASIISPLIHEDDRKKFSSTIKRILNFIGGKAIKELLPDSEFFRSLKGINFKEIPCLSFGGTSPSLFTLYRWKADKNNLKPKVLLSFPGILEKIIFKKFYPSELKKGYGDGLVSARSAKMPQCNNHYNFKVNHAGILFDEGVRKKIVEAVEYISADLLL